jgi:DNA-binding transcriptional LysR family regulator
MFSLVVTEAPALSRAAALMGLSVPTVKRRLGELEQRRAACA